MLASEYADKYLHLRAMFYGDQVSEVAIDKYLNAGITGAGDEKPHPADYRANRAIAEKNVLLGEVARELKVPGRLPPMFELEGVPFKLKDVVRPFFGKGSPSDVMDVVWLASRYKRVTATTARAYSTKYLGLDCNGFASNYWGMSDPMNAYIGLFDENRRKAFADVSNGDALVFYWAGTTGSPFHLAVVDRVLEAKADGTLRFTITQSAGLEQGVHTDEVTWKLTKNRKGEVVWVTDKWVVQFAAGPAKGEPNGQYWAVSD